MTVAIVVAYDGKGFHGCAASPGVRTVESVLTAALEKVLRHEIVLQIAGRTDRGVHASQQVMSFQTSAPRFDPWRLRGALNKLCRPDIAVSSVEVAADGFDARFSAVSRTYRYRVLAAEVPDPLRIDRVWYVERDIDIDAMNAAASHVIGLHDFRAFCRRRPDATGDEPLLRRVQTCSWSRSGDEHVLDVTANAYCHQLVRSLVGAMVAVGLAKFDPAHMLVLLESTDRTIMPAPPQGLTLVGVSY